MGAVKQTLAAGEKYSIHFNFILGVALSEEGLNYRSASFNTGKLNTKLTLKYQMLI